MLNNNLKKDASPGTLISFIVSINGLALGLAVIFGIMQIAGIAWLSSIKLRSPAVFASPSSLSRVDIGNDWIRYEKNDTPQFAISLPSDWTVTEFRFDGIERFADDIASSSPDLAALLQSEDGKKQLECCMKMYAYHPDGDGSAETLVMTTVPVKPGTELEGFVNAQFVEMKKNLIQPGSGKRERVPNQGWRC